MARGGLQASGQTSSESVRTYMVPMRDGVKLSTDIYFSAKPVEQVAGVDPRQAPAILVRTPYGKQTFRTLGLWGAALGYAVVVQDVRGRYGSQGDFQLVFNEGEDGYDTIEWVAAQPWCNGKVGMFGMSYMGIVQWAAAIKAPPHLVCIMPIVAPADYYQQLVYQGGALRQELVQNWLETMAEHSSYWETHRAHPPAIPGLQTPPDQWIWRLPLSDPGPIARGGPSLAALWAKLLDHPAQDAVWEKYSPSTHYDNVKVPALIVGGWYDVFSQGCIQNYLGLKAHGGSPQAREHTHLIMGPYTHGLRSTAGQRDFGARANLQMEILGLLWFNHWLKGDKNGVEKWASMRSFVMGPDQWVERPSWPPADAKVLSYYLSNPQEQREGGALGDAQPGEEKPSTYTYDPHDPVPTRGGNTLMIASGVYDQRVVEKRPDVLLFTTPPLAKAVHVAGQVQVRLYASASTPDTDFTAKLVDVGTDDSASNVLDGIIRGRFRQSFEQPALNTPDQPFLYTIDLWSTEYVFAAGRRIRLEISSSNFPRFSRNLNTGTDNGKDAIMRVGNIQVFHDHEHPSTLELPVVP